MPSAETKILLAAFCNSKEENILLPNSSHIAGDLVNNSPRFSCFLHPLDRSTMGWMILLCAVNTQKGSDRHIAIPSIKFKLLNEGDLATSLHSKLRRDIFLNRLQLLVARSNTVNAIEFWQKLFLQKSGSRFRYTYM